MAKTKVKSKTKLPLKITAITVVITFVVTVALVWLANFNYLYQKQSHASLNDTHIDALDIELDKLAKQTGSINDCLKPHWPWSEKFCANFATVVYAGSGNIEADKKLVLSKLKNGNFTPQYMFASNGPYLELSSKRTTLALLSARDIVTIDKPDEYTLNHLAVTFTKKVGNDDLAAQIKNSTAKYFIVFDMRNSFTSGW